MTGRIQARQTLAVVAREAGVSVPTVSKVLRERADVAPATRARVREVLDRMGYPREATAARRAKLGTALVDVLIHELDTAWSSLVIATVERRARAHGLGMVVNALESAAGRYVAPRPWLDQVAARGTCGVLGVVVDFSVAQVDYLAELGVPVIAVDPPGEADERVLTVHAGNRAGERAAVEHLLHLGHRRIAVVAGHRGMLAAEERLAGFFDALDHAGIAMPPEYVRSGGFSFHESERAMADLLALPVPPTAVVFASDKGALAGYCAVAAAGLRIPEDMSIVGFDDVIAAASAIPPLTTVRQPVDRMVAAALDAIVNGWPGGRRRAEFPAELVVRASTAPVIG
jgi:DNA-binding LacI/PurR family transcriptional regulator